MSLSNSKVLHKSNTTTSSSFSLGKMIFLFIPLIVLVFTWSLSSVLSNNFILQVDKVFLVPAFETKWLYFYAHLFTIIPVLLLSFDRRVAFYKRWKSLLPAISIIAIFFIAWDVIFTRLGVWTFNAKYISGIELFHLPIEEILFFFTIPFSSCFIYECLNHYVKKELFAPIEAYLTTVLIVVFFATGIFHHAQLYTSTTFLLAGTLLLGHYLYGSPAFRNRFYLAYIISCLPFMLVNGVLTGGYSQEPIVIYNPEEYLGIRLSSVPLDDAIYSFLLLFSIFALYEKIRKNNP